MSFHLWDHSSAIFTSCIPPYSTNTTATHMIILGCLLLMTLKNTFLFNYSMLHGIPQPISLAMTSCLSSDFIVPAGHFEMVVAKPSSLEQSLSFPSKSCLLLSTTPHSSMMLSFSQLLRFEILSSLTVSSPCIVSWPVTKLYASCLCKLPILSLHTPFLLPLL